MAFALARILSGMRASRRYGFESSTLSGSGCFARHSAQRDRPNRILEPQSAPDRQGETSMNTYPTCSTYRCGREATWSIEHTEDRANTYLAWACDDHASQEVGELMLDHGAAQIQLNRLTPDYVAFMHEGTQANA
jgi:hypothetical protein